MRQLYQNTVDGTVTIELSSLDSYIRTHELGKLDQNKAYGTITLRHSTWDIWTQYTG